VIAFESALNHVINHSKSLGSEEISLVNANGRFLDENIMADRDFPPFNRVTMDGYAIVASSWQKGQSDFIISGMARAGSQAFGLSNTSQCVEVTTGAVLPEGCDTVIPYEQTEKHGNTIKILFPPKKGQNIHKQGSDSIKGSLLLKIGSPLSPIEIAVLATVGKARIRVKKVPKVIVLSTGDELVPVDQVPQPHQIRMSNSIMIASALQYYQIQAEIIHIPDDPELIASQLTGALSKADVLLISGGVSMGPFDYLPYVLEKLGVQKHFHRVAQKPGKPIWFGSWKKDRCVIFALPGNPVSAFLNYLLYFRTWLMQCWEISQQVLFVQLEAGLENNTKLKQFIPVKLNINNAVLSVSKVSNNGSGDFFSLTEADGFIKIDPDTHLPKAALVHFIPFRPF
jgi:molybdopterin molybdotransferase